MEPVNRKLIRPSLTEMKDPRGVKKTNSAGSDQRGEFLLSEADAVEDADDHRAERWGNHQRRYRMVRQRLLESEPRWRAESADFQVEY